jgi:DNA-binding CsgD family transcriptional regulator/predicted ATPase
MTGPASGAGPEVDAVLTLLAEPDVWLVTLLGTGGVGKTRRSRAVAGALAAAGTPVRTVELAAEPSPDAGLAACGTAFDAVAGHRADDGSEPSAAGCVVLENLEVLAGSAGALGELIEAHPGVTVLATSRVASGLSAEHLHRVTPLPVAAAGAAEDAASAEGIELFLRYARRVACEPDLDARRPTVAAVCRRLDGLPLALITAAGQLRAMTVTALLARLEEGWSPAMRGPVDLPERQSTLARTLGDSVARLSPGGQALFRFLGLFEGRIEYATVTAILSEAHAATQPDHASASPAASPTPAASPGTARYEPAAPPRSSEPHDGPAPATAGQAPALGAPGPAAPPLAPDPHDTPDARHDRAPAPATAPASRDAPAACHGPDGLWDLVSELVAHSLLVPDLPADIPADGHAAVAFRMLSTTRDHARRAFRDDPDRPRLRQAHAVHHSRWVLADQDAYGADAEAWTRRLDAELGDVRAALGFLAESGDERFPDLAAGLRSYWLARGLLQEGLAWLDQALAVGGESRAWVRALEARAVLAGAADSYAHALPDLERCAARWQELDEPAARARTLVDLGAALFEMHGFERAEPVYQEAIEALDASGERWWAARARSLYGASAATVEDRRDLAMATLDQAVEEFRALGEIGYTNVPLQQLGRMLHEAGHDVQATALLGEGLSLARQVGDAWNTSIFLNLLAEVARHRGDSADAGAHYLESLKVAGEMGARPRFIWCLEGLAGCLDDLGETQHAARLVGLTHAVRDALGLHDWTEFPARATDLSGVRAGFPPPVFARLCAEGARMTVGDVLEAVPPLLAVKRPPAPRKGRRHRYPDGLTSREAEVLRLIASGATSRAIATELFISVETVGRHISNLYRKIGVSGRAEATVYAMRSGLLAE